MSTCFPSPPSKYSVIYADPPWTFKTFSKKGIGRSAEAHYDCLSIEDICRIPVKEWTMKDALLFLWITDPLLPQAMEVIKAWGFNYKTIAFYWVKLNKTANRDQLTEKDFFTGLGFWTRANPEICLLATKGHPKRKSTNVRRLLISPRREHSRKPDGAYERIEQLVGGPYLEMFARHARPGWDSWGNQTILFNHGSVETRRIPSDLRKYPLDDL
jgi:N6-adenosine-specific RNA methylase IME4